MKQLSEEMTTLLNLTMSCVLEGGGNFVESGMLILVSASVFSYDCNDLFLLDISANYCYYSQMEWLVTKVDWEVYLMSIEGMRVTRLMTCFGKCRRSFMQGRSFDIGLFVTCSCVKMVSLVTKNYCMQHCYLGKGTEVNEVQITLANVKVFKKFFFNIRKELRSTSCGIVCDNLDLMLLSK